MTQHTGQLGFELRRANTADRKEARADKLDAEAKSRHATVDTMVSVMNGQPLLIGHHSEKRHRRDLERVRTNMTKGIEASEKAKRLRSQVAHPSTAISGDDPEAVVKLKTKLAKMEEQRAEYKKVNKAIRKKGATPESIAESLGYSLLTVTRLLEPDWCGRIGIPGYTLTNLGANIRRVQKRIDALATIAVSPEPQSVSGNGWTIEEDADDNRVLIHFDTKPSKDVCRMMRTLGFKWSPTRGAWCRQITSAARYKATVAAAYLAEVSQ